MKKSGYILVSMIIATSSISALSMASEEKGHICFRIIDSDKDGKVTFQEFEKYFGNDLEKFKAIDLDEDGTLSHDEYHQSLGHGS